MVSMVRVVGNVSGRSAEKMPKISSSAANVPSVLSQASQRDDALVTDRVHPNQRHRFQRVAAPGKGRAGHQRRYGGHSGQSIKRGHHLLPVVDGAQPLRAALTGRSTSPGVFDVLAVVGREESLGRIADQAALKA